MHFIINGYGFLGFAHPKLYPSRGYPTIFVQTRGLGRAMTHMRGESGITKRFESDRPVNGSPGPSRRAILDRPRDLSYPCSFPQKLLAGYVHLLLRVCPPIQVFEYVMLPDTRIVLVVCVFGDGSGYTSERGEFIQSNGQFASRVVLDE